MHAAIAAEFTLACAWSRGLLRSDRPAYRMDAQRNETNTAVIAPGSAGDHADTDSGDALPAQTALLAVDVRVAIEGVGTYRDVRIIRGEGSNPCPYEDRRSIDAVAVGFRTGKTNQTEQRTVLEDIRYAEAEFLRSSISYRTLVGTSSSAEGDVSMTDASVASMYSPWVQLGGSR